MVYAQGTCPKDDFCEIVTFRLSLRAQSDYGSNLQLWNQY